MAPPPTGRLQELLAGNERYAATFKSPLPLGVNKKVGAGCFSFA